MDQLIIWQVLALILVIAGLAGTVLPGLPGSLMVFAGLLLAAWSEQFQYVSTWTLIALAMITALTYIVDFAASVLGAKRLGACPQAIWGALLGGLLGLSLGLVGFLLGPFIGAMAVQYAHDKDLLQAGKVGLGAWLGMVIGTALKLALTILMIGIYLLQRFL